MKHFFALLLVGFSLNAQNNFEKAVSEDYGTLLENLLVDGKIDQANAKAYLETIFGHNDNISSFLQAADFSQQLSSIANNGNLSLSALNSSLLSLVPQDRQQAFQSELQKQMLYQSGVNDLFSGKVSISVFQMAADMFQSIKEEKAAKLKKEAIAKKLEAITPTLAKLNATDKPYTKLKIVDEVDNPKNWVVNANPSVRDDGQFRYTKNPTSMENGVLRIGTDTQSTFFSSEKMAYYELEKTYKNPEKFDFSKDFKMNLYFRMEKKDDQYFTVEIGNGYRLTIQRRHSFGDGMLMINTPLKYSVSDQYGVLTETKVDALKEKMIFDKEKGVSIMQLGKSIKSFTIPENYRNNGISFAETAKLTIIKRGNVFSCTVNDLPVEMTSEITYFPNKYFLGFAVYSYVVNKKAFAEIQKLELEHL